MPVMPSVVLVHEPYGELQLPGGVAAVGQRSAHERAGALLAEHHLAQDGLVELDEVAALVAQRDDLVSEDGHHVRRQVVGVGVGVVGETLEPDGAGQHVGAGQRHLDLAVRVLAHESQLVEREALPPAEAVDDDGVPQGEGRHVEAPQHLLHARPVPGVVHQVRHPHHLHAGQLFDREGVEVVAPLLPVAYDVHPGLFLGADAGQHLRVGDGVEVVGGDVAVLLAAQGPEEVGGARPASDDRDGE